MRFGEWLRKQREANGLSMDAVASMTGLDKQYIQQVETDQIVHPGADKLMRLAEVYYVDLREMYRRAPGQGTLRRDSVKRLVWTLILVLCFGSLALAGVGRHGHFEGFPVVKVLVNGQEVASDVPAVNFHGRTMVPVRFVAEALWSTVEWDEETWTVSISNRLTEEQYHEQIQAFHVAMASMSFFANEVLAGRNLSGARDILELFDAAEALLFMRPPKGYEDLHLAAHAEVMLCRQLLKNALNLPASGQERLDALGDLRNLVEAVQVLDRAFQAEVSAKGIVLEPVGTGEE